MACYCHLLEWLLFIWVTSRVRGETCLVYKSHWHVWNYFFLWCLRQKNNFTIESSMIDWWWWLKLLWCSNLWVCIDLAFTENILDNTVTILQQCWVSRPNRIIVTVRRWSRRGDRQGRERAAPKWVFHLYASEWLRGVLLRDKDWPLRPLKTNRGPGTACYNSSITAARMCSTIAL